MLPDKNNEVSWLLCYEYLGHGLTLENEISLNLLSWDVEVE